MSLQICRDECDVLEYGICHKELAIARDQPMLNQQLVLPDCGKLPVIGSSSDFNCVRLGIPSVAKAQLIKPHNCYTDYGGSYRGKVSVTRSGLTCKPWHLSFQQDFKHIELVGGHNYCRNPGDSQDEPWCFTSDPR